MKIIDLIRRRTKVVRDHDDGTGWRIRNNTNGDLHINNN